MSFQGRPADGRRVGKIAFAEIEPQTLHGHLPESVRLGLTTGSRVRHQRREWILGAMSEQDEFLFGKLGFEHLTRGSRFDDRTGDFVNEPQDDGNYSVFGISLESLRVVFQTRGSEISPQSFSGALQALLNANSQTERWRVRRYRSEVTYKAWIGRVERLDHVRIKVERPNPHYHGNDQVEAIVEGLRAEVAQLSAKADPDDPLGLDKDADLLNQLVAHGEDYGEVNADGVGADGQKTVFRSGSAAEEITVELDQAAGEVPQEELRRQLEDRF